MTKTFEQDGEKIQEEVTLDHSKEVEVIKLSKDGGKTITGVVAYDYRRVCSFNHSRFIYLLFVLCARV